MLAPITWWEHEELLEHLKNRPDIWSATQDPSTWLRTDKEGTALCALRFRGPDRPNHRFRQFQVLPIELAWDVDTTQEYALRLLRKWTSYGIRIETANLLLTELGLAANVANAAAIAIAGIEQTGIQDPDGSVFPAPTQGELWPDSARPELPAPLRERAYRYIGFFGGGFSIDYRGGRLHFALEIAGANKVGFYSTRAQYSGIIWPRSCTVEQAAAYLFEGRNEKETEHDQQEIPPRPVLTGDDGSVLGIAPARDEAGGEDRQDQLDEGGRSSTGDRPDEARGNDDVGGEGLP